MKWNKIKIIISFPKEDKAEDFISLGSFDDDPV